MGRPQFFTIDPSHQLARGLVFAGLGNAPSGKRHIDSSLFNKPGEQVGLFYSWKYCSELLRYGVLYRGDWGEGYHDLGTSPIIRPAGAMTIAGWFSLQTVVSDGSGIGCMGYTGDRGYFLGISGAQVATAYVAPTSESIFNTADPTTFPLNTLMHLAMVFIPSTGIYLYKNGVLVSSNTTTPPASQRVSLSTKIGARGNTDATARYIGIIADPMIYNRTLTLAEIQQLANPSNYMLSGLIRPIGQQSNIYDLAGIR